MLEAIFEKTSITDAFLIIITSFAIVGFWRGVWGLMDLYLFPGNYVLSLVTSMIMGLVVLFTIAFYRKRKKR